MGTWRRGRWLWLAVAGLAGVSVAGLAVLSWASCDCDKVPAATEAARVVAGFSFVVAGVVGLAHRRLRRVGFLMSAVGWTWFAYELGYIYQPLPYTIARLSAGFWQPLLAHLAIAFPSGRLRSRLDRLVVTSAYVLYWGTSSVLLAFWYRYGPTGGQTPGPHNAVRNLLSVHYDARWHEAAEFISQALVILVAVAVLAVVFWHWRTATVAARRALDPLVWASGPLAAVVIAYTVLGARQFPAFAPLAMVALPASFLTGLLRMRLSRAGVGPLVVELGQTPAGDRLQAVLARTLHDPTLRLLYWARERQSFVDTAGQPAHLVSERSTRVVRRIDRDGEPIAALVHDPALQDDPELVEAAVAAARLALENERLHAEVSAQLVEVRSSRARIIAAGDAERRRVERNLHDGAQQRLVTLSGALKLAQTRLHGEADGQLGPVFQEAARELDLALAELRELAQGIHPAILTEAGLGPALESLAQRSSVPVRVLAAPEHRLDSEVEAAAYFVVSEAIANAMKHSRASLISVQVRQTEAELLIEVADDGIGGAALNRGAGLQGIADRVRALDGSLDVISPDGAGTRVIGHIPCAQLAAHRFAAAHTEHAGRMAT